MKVYDETFGWMDIEVDEEEPTSHVIYAEQRKTQAMLVKLYKRVDGIGYKVNLNRAGVLALWAFILVLVSMKVLAG